MAGNRPAADWYGAAPVVPEGAADVVRWEQCCIACGYSLSGLPVNGTCPECGTPVAHSLRGDLLKFRSPEYLAALYRGVCLVMAGVAGWLIQLVVGIFGSFMGGVLGGAWPSISQWADKLLGLLVSGAFLYGWWLLSALDPGHAARDDGATARKVVRMTVVVSAAATLIAAVVALLPGSPVVPTLGRARSASEALAAAVNLAAFLALVVQYFASMRYIQWLSRRIPSDRIGRRAGLLTWLGPVLMTVGCLVVMLGPLVALVMYWNMLEWARLDLRQIREEQSLAALAETYGREAAGRDAGRSTRRGA